MAKTMKPSDVKTAGGPTPEVIKRAITEAQRHKGSAATYSGYHGDVVSKFCESTGIHRKAFSLARTLHALEDDKRQAIIRDLGTMFRALGFFDQGDLFHPVGMETVVGDDEIAARGETASGMFVQDDDDDLTPAQRKARKAADRAEARKKPVADVLPDAAARAATTAAELDEAPAEVAESFTERMRRQNDGVDAENAKALGALVN
jgi:hypothetical protein